MNPVDRLTGLVRDGANWSSSHPRTVAAGIALILAGSAVTAFGVAPMTIDAAIPQPVRVTQSIEPSGLDEQLEALAAHELELDRSTVTRPGDTLDSIMQRVGVSDAQAVAALRAAPWARSMWSGRPGKRVQATASASGRLSALVIRQAPADSALASTHFQRTTAQRTDDGWQVGLETVPLETQARLGSGTIRSSLFAASDEAGVPDSVAIQVAEVFSTEIDFHRELRRGDTFSVVYEALTADGEPITWAPEHGRLVAAEFSNDGKVHEAVWFDAGGKGAYFGFDGQSRRRAFLASPMEFSRVTSGFAMRMHPILRQLRAHKGVDYAAPTGTPVRTVGDGVVEFAGWQNGFGNVVFVRHSNDRTTVYAHLSRIGVRKGERVNQGQHIGAVGATGWATGPHLHFEFRVNGEHQDPLRMAKSSEAITIDPAQRPRFEQVAAVARAKLDVAQSLGGAAGDDRD